MQFITSGYLTPAGFASCTILIAVYSSSQQLSLSPFLLSYDTASKKLNVASVELKSNEEFRRTLQKRQLQKDTRGENINMCFH